MYFGMITVVTDVGFNRYIVECKFIIVTWIILSRLDLIDT